MTLWKVRVECFRKDVTHPVIRRYVVNALDHLDAQAQCVAAAGPTQWERVVPRETTVVTSPMEI